MPLKRLVLRSSPRRKKVLDRMERIFWCRGFEVSRSDLEVAFRRLSEDVYQSPWSNIGACHDDHQTFHILLQYLKLATEPVSLDPVQDSPAEAAVAP